MRPILRQSALGKLPEWTMFSQMSSMFLVALCSEEVDRVEVGEEREEVRGNGDQLAICSADAHEWRTHGDVGSHGCTARARRR